MQKPDDQGLLKAAAAGDEHAFAQLFRRYQEAVYRFAWRLTGSAATAEDLAQESFLRVLRSAGRFDPGRGSLRTYLYATVRNLAISQARPQSDGEEGAAEMLDTGPGPEELLLDGEASAIVQQAILMLPEAQREALVLIQYEGLSLEDAAQVLAIDVGAVKSRLHRARQNLKGALEPYFGATRTCPRKEE